MKVYVRCFKKLKVFIDRIIRLNRIKILTNIFELKLY